MFARTGPQITRTLGTLLAMSLALVLGVGGNLLLAPSARADSIREAEYWLDSLGIKDAHKDAKGQGVKVAVIDTGIDTSHPDLRGAVTGGTDVSGSGGPTGNTPIGARSEHGTLVATLLAGRGNNKAEIDRVKAENEKLKTAWEKAKKHAEEEDEDVPEEPEYETVPKPSGGPDGVLGVAPAAELMSVSLWMGGQNPAGIPVEEQIPRAVRWAVDNGAKVINMSLGSTSPAWPESWDSAFKYAEDHDVVVVAAAGNRSGGMSQVGAPATIPGVLTVAGVDESGKASKDSSTEGISIGVAAPAEPLVGGMPGGDYARWSGTSGAAPIVSGVVALIRSKYPQMKAPQVINRILKTAKDAGAPGVDNLYGYGIMDAKAALTADVAETSTNPLGTIAEWIHVHRRDTDAGAQDTREPGISMEKSDLKQVAAPQPVAPPQEAPLLQPALVIGAGVLLVLALGLGGWQVAAANRRYQRSKQIDDAALSDLKVGRAPGSRDLFDDVPE